MQEKAGQIAYAAANIKHTRVPSREIRKKIKTRYALQIPVLHFTIHSVVTVTRFFHGGFQLFHLTVFEQRQHLVNLIKVFSSHYEVLNDHAFLYHSSNYFPIRNRSEFLHYLPASIDVAQVSE